MSIELVTNILAYNLVIHNSISLWYRSKLYGYTMVFCIRP